MVPKNLSSSGAGKLLRQHQALKFPLLLKKVTCSHLSCPASFMYLYFSFPPPRHLSTIFLCQQIRSEQFIEPYIPLASINRPAVQNRLKTNVQAGAGGSAGEDGGQ